MVLIDRLALAIDCFNNFSCYLWRFSVEFSFKTLAKASQEIYQASEKASARCNRIQSRKRDNPELRKRLLVSESLLKV